MGSSDWSQRREHMDAAELERWAKWVVATCLTFGTTVSTAYKVAGLFVEGLERATTTTR